MSKVIKYCQDCGHHMVRVHEHWMSKAAVICLACERRQDDVPMLNDMLAAKAKDDNQ